MPTMHTHLLLSLVLWQCASGIQVDTQYGTVEGMVETLVDDDHYGVEINSFYSIPFAKSPVGDLRFEPPQEPDPFDGVYVADQLLDACEQDPALIWLTNPGWNDHSEDCLHLSIWAPADQSGAPYSVMFFIYGGGYQSGANIMYLGHFLASRGVVVVIPNYRLGVFGFGWSGDNVIPGNMGLMDQELAMRYVQNNIAAFGGDPTKVTIFGESAGASSVGQQLVSPRTEGLFHQAIPQSGSELAPWGTYGVNHDAPGYLEQVAEQLDCPTEDTTAMAECLREKPARALRTTDFNCTEGRICMGFVPVVDGEGGYLPDLPYNLREQGAFHKVPEMIGINRNEAFLVLIGPAMANMTYEEFENAIRTVMEYFIPSMPDETRHEDVVQALTFYYSPWPHIHDSYQLRHQIGEVLTDIAFGATSDLQAKYHRDHAPTYYYIYDYLAPGTLPEHMGTVHGMELPYVFGFPFVDDNPDVQNQTGIRDVIQYTDVDKEYSILMMDLWTNFAKYGNPTPSPVETPGDFDPVTWETYTADNLYYIYIGHDRVEQDEDFRQHEYAFWQHYLPWVVHGDEGIPTKGLSEPLEEDFNIAEELQCLLEQCALQDLLEDYYSME